MVKVFADSTSDLDAPIAEKEGVGIIPLTVTLGEESFDDGAGVSFLEMSRRIEAEHIVPKTAAPSPQRFYDAFLPELQKGNTVLCFCVSSGISSTYQNACIARDQLKDVGWVDVIYSKACGISIGISAVLAARAGRAGLDHDTVYAQGLRRVSKMETLVLLDDLDYLVMGGRISALAAKAVSIMNIKPVITFDEEGKIYIRHKSLGFKKGMKWLCEQAVEKGKDFGNTILGFAYCLDRSRAEQLADMVKSQVRVVESITTQIGCVIGAYTGTKGVAVFFERA